VVRFQVQTIEDLREFPRVALDEIQFYYCNRFYKQNSEKSSEFNTINVQKFQWIKPQLIDEIFLLER